MMLLWMTYAVFIGGLVALGAFAVDRIARIARAPMRWIWLAAIVASIALSLRAPSRLPTGRAPDIELPSSASVSPPRAPSWREWAIAELAPIARWLDVSRATRAFGASAIVKVDGRIVAAAWIASSVVLGLIFAGVHVRFGRSRRDWPLANVSGESVRISPRIGPAAMGLVRAEVIVPRWLLTRADADQRMAIAHEAEHVRAYDPQLLGAACLALVLFPWNPALWFLVSRLRLAIELDCDRRVLARGATPQAYGTLLVAVAELSSSLRPSALALADDSSHLQTRILAMEPARHRFARTQVSVAAMLAGIAILAACEAKSPTASDIDRLSATSAESAAHKLGLIRRDTTMAYVVNGVPVSAQEARAVPAADIEQMEIAKRKEGGGTITITKKGGVNLERKRPVVDTSLAEAVTARAADAHGGLPTTTLRLGADTAVVWFVDGVQVDYATGIRSLDRNSVESVEVLKGPAASQAFDVPLGKAVVSIRTKR